MLSKMGKALRIISDEDKKNIAIILDGSTILPDFEIHKMCILKDALSEIGTIRTGKVIFDKQITQKESNLLNDQGFQEEIVGSDVDIHLAISILEYMNSQTIDIIGIGTTNPNLYPVFIRIKKEKKLLLISWKEDVTQAMESIADYILYLDYLK